MMSISIDSVTAEKETQSKVWLEGENKEMAPAPFVLFLYLHSSNNGN